MKNIVTIFSGRKANIQILKKYLDKALELNIIDEVHFWNFAKNKLDEEYLHSISNLKRTSSTASGNYFSIHPTITDNSFDLFVKASNDIHVKLTHRNREYEIVLGGWNNTKSVIRLDNQEIFALLQNNIADGNNFIHFKFSIVDSVLHIYKHNELFISQSILHDFEIQDIFFKTGHSSVGDLSFNTSSNNGYFFMDTCEKTWKNYYHYYDCTLYVNDIIIKCDDDIVFIDLYKLPRFIHFIRNNDYDLVFANIINNGVSAFYQQNKFNLIPYSLMTLEYPNGGFCGSLWDSANKAETLHRHFIDNHATFLDYDYNNEIIPILTRFSINFFGFKGKNWYKIKDAYVDDEYNLTVRFVHDRQFNNVLYTDFYVSHLSFFRQLDGGMDLNAIRAKYLAFFDTLSHSHRFCPLAGERSEPITLF
jgi:hypothetical protein